jgi:fatty acid desaturase
MPASAVVDGEVTRLRAEYSDRFPVWSQQLITRVTGKAAPGQRVPRTVLPPLANVVATVVQWPAAVALGVLLYQISLPLGVLCTPLIWLLSLNSLRRLQVVVAHHAVHREIVRSHRLSYAIQAVVSAMSLVHNWEDYFEDHVRGHHSRKVFTTPSDPDAAFLLQLGFRPGMSLPTLRRRLHRCVVSPRFHWLFLKARYLTNFTTAPAHRKIMALVVVACLAGTFFLMPAPIAVVLVLVPMFPLYHVSALLQFISEHNWLVTEHAPVSADDYARRTRGRFCITALPRAGTSLHRRITGWARWLIRVLVFVLPTRFGVLVGDLPAHDLHHLYPQEHDWTGSLWRRQDIIERGDSKGMRDREFSTLTTAIDSVFVGMSRHLAP